MFRDGRLDYQRLSNSESHRCATRLEQKGDHAPEGPGEDDPGQVRNRRTKDDLVGSGSPNPFSLDRTGFRGRTLNPVSGMRTVPRPPGLFGALSVGRLATWHAQGTSHRDLAKKEAFSVELDVDG